jgi:alkylation response protein AidB-like acyl-CoA dehydrogenase
MDSQKHKTNLASNVNLLPKNFEHNYYSPKDLMTSSRLLTRLDSERVKKLMWTPLFREFWKKTLDLYRRNPKMEYLNTFESSKQELRDNANYIFTKTWKNLDYDYESYKKNPVYMINCMITHGFTSMSAGTKVGVHFGLYTKTLLSLGTEKHRKWIKRAFDLSDYGCFMLTEMGHGSNVQGIITTATYDHSTRSFILNTSLDMGMKFWIGNLAQTANMGVVFANLIIDGKNEGVHAFLIKLRDDDGNVSPGILIGDCGMKMGNNGIDNGWALFRSMKVGVDSLLNEFSWITDKGEFQSKIKSKSKRFAVQISALSGGRLGVGVSAAMATLMGCGIAIRYGTVRQQFGDKKGMENTLMSYPLVHSKLITRISNALIHYSISDYLDHEWLNVNVFDFTNIQVKELHALSSFIKAASSWNMKEALLKARELCGGHAFSAYSHLPTLIDDTEVHITWEGTNEVLLQQTCKNLMEEFNKFRTKGKIQYKSLQFLKSFDNDEVDLDSVFKTLKQQTQNLLTGEMSDLVTFKTDKESQMSIQDSQKIVSFLENLCQTLQSVLQLRLYEMVDRTLGKFTQFLTQINSTKNNFFRSFNKTLPHVLFPTSIFFGELFCFSALLHHISFIGNPNKSPFLFKEVPHFRNLSENDFIQEKIFYLKVLAIFASSTLSNSAQYLVGSHEAIEFSVFDSFNEILLKITNSMKFDVLTICDIVLTKDISLSSIAPFDGDIYKSIQENIFKRNKNFGKSPQWNTVRRLRKENSNN